MNERIDKLHRIIEASAKAISAISAIYEVNNKRDDMGDFELDDGEMNEMYFYTSGEVVALLSEIIVAAQSLLKGGNA